MRDEHHRLVHLATQPHHLVLHVAPDPVELTGAVTYSGETHLAGLEIGSRPRLS